MNKKKSGNNAKYYMCNQSIIKDGEIIGHSIICTDCKSAVLMIKDSKKYPVKCKCGKLWYNVYV